MSSQTFAPPISESTQAVQIPNIDSFSLDPRCTFPAQMEMDTASPPQELPVSPSKRRRTCSTSPSPNNEDISISALSPDDLADLQTELDEEDLDYETHAIRRALQETMQASNSKKDNYSRHVLHYVTFIETECERRSREHPTRKSNLTAEPVTIAKVALFLNFETTRPKVSINIANYASNH